MAIHCASGSDDYAAMDGNGGAVYGQQAETSGAAALRAVGLGIELAADREVVFSNSLYSVMEINGEWAAQRNATLVQELRDALAARDGVRVQFKRNLTGDFDRVKEFLREARAEVGGYDA